MDCNWINLISILNFPKQEITDAYSEPYQTSMMEPLTEKVNDF